MIEPALMRMLVAVAAEGSLARAGERLGITQQAVSGQLKRLETLTGRRLADRGTRSVSLTAEGEALLRYAHRALRLEDEVRRHFADVTLSGSLRIGVSEGFTGSGLPVLLRALRGEKPDLEITVLNGRTARLEAALDGGTLDLVIGIQRAGEGRGEAVLSDAVCWVGDAALAGPRSPVRLAAHPEPSVLRAMMADALTAAGRPYAVTFESESRASLRAAVLAGLAFSAFCLDPDPGAIRASVEAGLPELGRIDMFVRRAAGMGDNDAAEAMVRLLRATAGEIVAAASE